MRAATMTLDPAYRVGDIDPRIYGSFVEHMGRCVYEGIYEPGHPRADAAGFRGDVAELVRQLGVPALRYPGGNFVSGYDWEDGIGPAADRPRRLDLAWRSIETNRVGVDEFVPWCRSVGSEPMLAVNLGTRGVDAARSLVEYCNIGSGTEWSDLRRRNGAADPHGVKLWCLGNEMDGPWQIGHKPADEYARLAAASGRAMRRVDPTIELVACGSSHARMPTFGSWERTVLEQAYDVVDYISMHAYYEPRGDDRASFLACAVDLDNYIDGVVATCDHVRAVGQHTKRINISLDEWNVWYASRAVPEEQMSIAEAPHLIEDTYNVVDAVVVGSLLVTMLRHADRVRIGCLAQLVNVIAPIMTEPGGPAWRQTTFFPFAITSRLAVGEALDVKLTSDTYQTAIYGEVPLVDAVATHDTETGRTAIFVVNRSLDAATTVEVDVSHLGAVEVLETHLLADDDIYATNTLSEPERVGVRSNDSAVLIDGRLAIELPAVSWTAIALG